MKSVVVAVVLLSSALLSGCAVYPAGPTAVVAPAPVVVAPAPYYYGGYYYGGYGGYGGYYYGGHRYWR